LRLLRRSARRNFLLLIEPLLPDCDYVRGRWRLRPRALESAPRTESAEGRDMLNDLRRERSGWLDSLHRTVTRIGRLRAGRSTMAPMASATEPGLTPDPRSATDCVKRGTMVQCSMPA